MDQEELSNLFEKNMSIPDDSDQYTSVEYNIVEAEATNFSIGQFRFNLRSQSSQLQVYSDSYLMLPLSIASSTGSAYTSSAANKIAIKTSLLSLFYGMSVRTDAGASIVDEHTMITGIMANLRLLLDSTVDF